jgi:hypothetical protein
MRVFRPSDSQHDRENDDDYDDDVEGMPRTGSRQGGAAAAASSGSGGCNGTMGSRSAVPKGGARNDFRDGGDDASLFLGKMPPPPPPPPHLPLSPSSPSHRRQRQRQRAMRCYTAATAVAAVVVLLVLLVDDSRLATLQGPLAAAGRSAPASSSKPEEEEAPRDPRILLGETQVRFREAKAGLLDAVVRDYGREFANDRFLLSSNSSWSSSSSSNASLTTNATRGRRLFTGPGGPDDPSGWDGLRRKLTIKLLRALQGSDTSADGRGVPVVWVTSGNSVAAGHGNLLNESYTAVLERAVAPLFAALGMSFVGRNYGVSAASSGPNIALCMEAKFGTDVDLLLWDFRLTGALLPMLLFLWLLWLL